MKKISVLLSFFIIFNIGLSNISVTSFAADSLIMTNEGGIDVLPDSLSSLGGNVQSYWFYPVDDDYFSYVPLSTVVPSILLSLGIVTNSSVYANYYSRIISKISSLMGDCIQVLPPAGGEVPVGYAKESLAGRRYKSSLDSDSITIPDSVVDNIYDEWQAADLAPVDYFILMGDSVDLHIPDLNDKNVTDGMTSDDKALYKRRINFYNNLPDKSSVFSNVGYDLNSNYFFFDSDRAYCSFDVNYLVCTSSHSSSTSSFDDIVNGLNLENGGFVGSGDMISKNLYFYGAGYSGSFSRALGTVYELKKSEPYYTISSVDFEMGGWFGYKENVGQLFFYPQGSICVFRNIDVMKSVVSKEYKPSVYTTNNYNNYDSTVDNSVTYTKSQVENISNNYSTIYENADNSYYNYVNQNTTTKTYEGDTTNNTYDNSSSVVYNEETNTTTVTYNYYGIDQDGLNELVQTLINQQLNINNDSGSGSGSGSGSDDDSSSGIWDRLANGLADFFKAIGKVIGGIITGIVEMVTNVIEALTTIPEAFSGFTDFLAACFPYFPEILLKTIGVGFSLCVVVAVIKFLRG